MNDRATPSEQPDLATRLTGAVEDTRQPYEPPRLMKKRTVARATLFTAVGASMMTLTASG